jgi:large subunit ribosomal protein L22
MEATAHSRFARYSSRKINQVLGVIRGKNAEIAFQNLAFVPRAARVLVEKTLKSAVANSGKELSGLIVTKAWVGIGPALKRVRPHAMGSRTMYKRKTSHLTIVVSDGQNGGSIGS